MLNKGIATKLGISKWINHLFESSSKRSLKLAKELEQKKKKVAERNKTKVFVIGFNKTGTTSVEHTLKDLGYILGDQGTAEFLLDDIIASDHASLYDYIETAEAFQDVPFSLPGVFKIVYNKYPYAKFILSVRDTPEQWYNSILNFHTKVFGKGIFPSKDILENAEYRYRGYAWKYINYTFDGVIYEEDFYKKIYLEHIDDVESFFKDKADRICKINVANKEDYQKLCTFLGVKAKKSSFEWKNKTESH